MNNNVCIILLILLIVYLIYKISSNSCDCFSVGSQTCNGFTKYACDAGQRAYKCEWNASTNKCEQRKISLRPENPSEFLARINEAYGDSNSNGVFISMILDDGMDGSGSVLHKDIYTDTYLRQHSTCCFGFIWNTDWLTTNSGNLVECLFSRDIGSSFYPNTNCNSPNFCKLANTNSRNKPDRCSAGLYYFNGFKKKNRDFPNPTSCKQNKIYDLAKMDRVEFKNGKNCFTYINYEMNNKAYITDFNEGVFLKDNIDSVNYHEGINQLNESEKPLPSALLFIYNDNVKCTKDVNYINTLEGLKYSFTSDTMVVKAQYDRANSSIISFDTDPTTLGEMPGYDKV